MAQELLQVKAQQLTEFLRGLVRHPAFSINTSSLNTAIANEELPRLDLKDSQSGADLVTKDAVSALREASSKAIADELDGTCLHDFIYILHFAF